MQCLKRKFGMEKLTVIELKTEAKRRGLSGYSKLRRAELINLLTQSIRKRPKRKIIFVYPEKRSKSDQNHSLPVAPIPVGQLLDLLIPVEQLPKKSAGNLLDDPIPEDEIPKEHSEGFLKPTKAKKIEKAVEWGKKEVENWGEWLKEMDALEARRPTKRSKVDDALEAFKSHIADLYKGARFELIECKSALKRFTRQYKIEGVEGYGPKRFLLEVKPTILTFLRENPDIKILLCLHCIMSKTDLKTGEVLYTDAYFYSKTEINFQSSDVEDLYKTMMNKMLESLAAYQQRGSNWVFDSIEELTLNTVKYEPLSGSSYIPLPKNLADKKAIINMKNNDNECFKWCITRALNPVDRHPERITKILQLQAKKLNWKDLKFPLELKDISRFENVNEVSVNVYGYNQNEIYPLRVSTRTSDLCDSHHVNLLLISEGEKKHYCLIKSMSRLLASQVSTRKAKKFFCPRCLNAFGRQDLLDKHLELCGDNEAVRIKMPEEGTFVQFKNYHKMMDMPFVIYADFESIMKRLRSVQHALRENAKRKKSYTEKKLLHVPVSFCYYVKCFFDDSKSKVVEFTAMSKDEDVAQKFVNSLEEEVKSIYKSHPPKKMIFTKHIEVDSWLEDEKEVVVKRELRFIDSYKFMNFPLEKLVNNLTENDFVNTSKYFSGEKLSLLKRKGVYPYEWLDSVERLNETQLPSKDAFYSEINGEGISVKDYQHAQKVWKVFNMKTMRDYHNLYNKTDVLLLADVFETFRKVCKKIYKLDPCWYYTAPGLSWDACLKLTGVKLELLTDPDMLLMFENGVRGGVSMISNRHGQANNKYMGERFDETLPSKYIIYTDANNLYGYSMTKKLPIGGFKWMTEKELQEWRSFGCVLEVDLEYPKELHNLHNDYPLAPERLKIDKVEKLIPNLNDKQRYIVHYESLKQYESMGLKITQIHRGIKFEESDWMRQYIDLNTRFRAEAKNEFEKEFFKLMNNSVYGKTIENLRKRVDISLVTSQKKAKRLTAKPNFKKCSIFSENLCAIEMRKTQIYFNKPVYLGMCILDLSKTLMYDFHYNYIKPKYGEKAKLLFTDTDSLAYEIQTEDFYRDISSDVHSKFDTSNFSENHPSGIPVGANKKVVGMFKDEAGGKIIEEFVELRAKLYSYKMFESEEEKKEREKEEEEKRKEGIDFIEGLTLEKKRCKGMKESVVKRTITFDDYKKCLFDGKPEYRQMNVFRSRKHEIFTEEINKVALSANDDKRIILPDKVNTLAYGHHATLSEKNLI